MDLFDVWNQFVDRVRGPSIFKSYSKTFSRLTLVLLDTIDSSRTVVELVVTQFSDSGMTANGRMVLDEIIAIRNPLLVKMKNL